MILATSAIVLGSVLVLSGQDADAVATPKMNFKAKTLTISVIDGGNSYGKTTLKLKNKKKFKVKKISYVSKNNNIAKVSKKGIVTSQSPGKTNIIATVKYRNKSTKNKKLKKKKITISITVKSAFKTEIPKTGIQYDETGKAEAIFPYTPPDESKGVYSNEASYIDRFPVYVETDYDTDQDGKRDLIMAIVQVPRAAVEGHYQAPVIMDANPYLVEGHRSGPETQELLTTLKKNSFDYRLLMNSPDKRIPQSEITTKDAAEKASDWVQNLDNKMINVRALKVHDYYMTRGYASVISPGLGGSKECDGLQCCGEKVEALAYAAVIEWLHGDRTGYADRKGTKQLRADWCNGHTALTGSSYEGTLAYEVATFGVEGLDTVIPCSAISSWYNYVNCQGVVNNICSTYMSWLGDNCAKRFQYSDEEEEKKDPVFNTYKNYLFQKNYDEVKAAGTYNSYWARFEFSKAKPTVPALLVQGLNDDNVCTNQTVMMRNAFLDAGCTCKVLYHQGRHDLLSIYGYVHKVNGESYDDLINRWLAHYMAGVDNGIDKLKDYTVQSNVDGSWQTYDEGRETEKMRFSPTGTDAESTVTFNSKELQETELALDDYQRKTKGMHADWVQRVDKDVTLTGGGTVHLRVKMPDTKKNNPAMWALLFDESDEEFQAYYPDPDGNSTTAAYINHQDRIVDICGDRQRFEISFATRAVKENLITVGAVNLRTPGAGWDAETAVEPKDPIQDNTYYDYTIYLNPTEYTVKKGHRLHLYVISFAGQMLEDPNSFNYVDQYTDEGVGSSPTMASQYEYTIDNENSYADLPIVKQ